MVKPGEFSVCQFFMDGSYDYEVRFVDAETVAKVFHRIATSVGGRIGTTQRVIITDGGDLTCMEWVHGKGVTFPPPGDVVDKDKKKGDE